jgi:26S proteasome non-ATPase regulatory subunit 10
MYMCMCVYIGDTAVALLKEEADFTLKTTEGQLPLDLAPDKVVRPPCS